MTKKAIDEAPECLITIVDNAVAKENVVKFATANGYGVSVEKEGEFFRIRMVAGLNKISSKNREAVVNLEGNGESAAVYLITRDTLGNGSDELGAILMKAFFSSLQEIKPLPRAVIFLNAGVRLAAEESPVLPALQNLSNKGVQVMSCGTCLDYFQLKEKLAIGSVSNMFSILAELNAQGRSITL